LKNTIEKQKEKQPAVNSTANIKKSTSPVTLTENIKVTFVELGSVKCIPCKMMQPIMDEIEKEYAGQVKVVFHDVWTPEGQPYAKEYGIQGIPTQVFLDKNGNEFHRHTGYYPKEEIVKVLKKQGVE
jgi:thioredoxin 1